MPKQVKSKIITSINMFITVLFYFQNCYSKNIIHIQKFLFDLSSFININQSIYSSHFQLVKDPFSIFHRIFHLSPHIVSFYTNPILLVPKTINR